MEFDSFYRLKSGWALICFYISCLFIVVFKDWGFGIWWAAICTIGTVPFFIANAPVIGIEWLLMNSRFKMFTVLVSVLHLVAVFPASYYALKALANWMYN